MNTMVNDGNTDMSDKSLPERLLGALALPWVACVTLLSFLAIAGGLWNLVANTRVLNLMIEGGVVRFHDKQIGPIVTGELRRRLNNGYVTRETMVWNENMTNWVSIASVPEFKD